MKTRDLILLGATGYVLYRLSKKVQDPKIETTQAIPPGAKPTGKVTRTTNGAKPGDTEVNGFAIRDWAEVVFPNGVSEWMEIKIKNPS